MSAFGDKNRAYEITVSAKGDKVRRGLHGGYLLADRLLLSRLLQSAGYQAPLTK